MDVSLARQQWQDGNRRVEERRDMPSRYALLASRVDVLVGGLRQRVGQTYTLAELADAYDGADEWARTVLSSDDPDAPPVAEPGTIADAAFHLYARGASDYAP
ncbi:MAG: hypothetical protein ACRDM1_06680 [Gaiellaceae bacterium]